MDDAGAFEKIVGRTIETVIYKQNPQHPRQQVFLLFTDGTYFEIFGGEEGPIRGADRVERGDAELVEYLGQKGQKIRRFPGS
ncbi:MAG: hypothetical protein R3225_10760 [Halofilum sp. (in: g-proteobacteria)]|nr:hypothetical protein [Halofilum sp. (in: g-proteobacteria)]